MLTDLETQMHLDDDIELFRFFIDRDQIWQVRPASAERLPWHEPASLEGSVLI